MYTEAGKRNLIDEFDKYRTTKFVVVDGSVATEVMRSRAIVKVVLYLSTSCFAAGRGDYIPTRVHWSLHHDVNVDDWLV